MTAPTVTPATVRRRGPDLIAYPLLGGRRYRLRGPAAVDVTHRLGMSLLVSRPQLDDVEAFAASSSPRLLLVIVKDKTNRRTS